MFFEALKLKIKGAIATIRLITYAVLILFCIGGFATCSHYKNKVGVLEAEKVSAEEAHKTKKAELEAEIKTIEANWAEDRIKANEKYIKDTKSIHALYVDRLRELDSVRHTATETIKYLPHASDETKTAIAIGGTNSVAECSATVVEMEKICRDYSAEIDKLISEWPTGGAKAVESRQE